MGIPDHEPNAFNAYLCWVYTNRIPLKQKSCGRCRTQEEVPETKYAPCNVTHTLDLAKMFILGDYLKDDRFCNAVVNMMKRSSLESSCFVPSETVQHSWEKSVSGGPLRDLVLEMWRHDLPDVNYAKLADGYPKDFLIDLLVYVGENASEDSSESLLEMECTFHKQGDDVSCCEYTHQTY